MDTTIIHECDAHVRLMEPTGLPAVPVRKWQIVLKAEGSSRKASRWNQLLLSRSEPSSVDIVALLVVIAVYHKQETLEKGRCIVDLDTTGQYRMQSPSKTSTPDHLYYFGNKCGSTPRETVLPQRRTGIVSMSEGGEKAEQTRPTRNSRSSKPKHQQGEKNAAERTTTAIT